MAHHHYDPNQPRIPAKHDGGGRWTADVPEPLSQLNAFFKNRDEDRREGTVRIAFSGKTRPRIKLPGGLGILGLAAEFIYSHLSEDNSEDQQTILAFRSREFRRNADNTFDLEGVRILTEKEVEDECGKNFKKVQQFTDEAVAEVQERKEKGESMSNSEFGIEVHKLVEAKIKKSGLKGLTAEITFAKPDSATGNEYPNARDTVRLDVLNRVNDTTICIDDIKTGGKGLSFKRMLELAESATQKDNKIKRVIVTQVRARKPPPQD